MHDDRTEKNRKLRMLAVDDESARESAAVEFGWSFTAQQMTVAL